MALSVLDGNQSATTLSSVVTGGEHIVAHSVVSLGSNAISNITTAVSGSVVTIPNLNVLARSVATEGITDGTLNFVKIGGHQDGSNQTAHIVHVSGGGAMKVDASDSTVTFGEIRGTVTIGNTVTIAGTVTANPTGTQTIAGTVTANAGLGFDSAVYQGMISFQDTEGGWAVDSLPPISGTVTANGGDGTFLVGGLRSGGKTALQLDTATGYLQTKVESLPSLVAGTAQIGSVTASISNSVTIASFATSVTARLINPAGTAVTYAEVGTAGNPSIDVLSVQGVTSGTPLTILNHQGTTVTTSNFTSTTASTVLASANTGREVLTIFNEGAGNLHICAGATCTTVQYQVRLGAGDYYEVPLNQTSLTHSAVFATAGTARIVQIS